MKKVLVVVDMQKDFIDGALGTKEAEAIVPKVIEKIKAYKDRGDNIYFTKDTHFEDYLETQEGKNLPVPHCIKGTEGWELADEIKVLHEDIVKLQEDLTTFEKYIFGSEALADYIREHKLGEDTLEIELVGLCTDICVLSNAIIMKAYMPEVKIMVDAACCAGVTPETHANALNAMKMCQIQIENE
ncbi:MAG: cysteine hydrolase family protein [Cellulosilyticaceae bacterium]